MVNFMGQCGRATKNLDTWLNIISGYVSEGFLDDINI